MEEGIKIQKTTLGLLVALVLVVVIGAYIASASPSGTGTATGPGAEQKSATNSTVPTSAVPIALGSGSASGAASVQDIYIHANPDGTYDKKTITVQKGQPVRLHFTADPSAGCGRQVVIYGLNVRASSMNGEEGTADFTPNDAGTYQISCGMKMWGPAQLIVQ